jgi:ATP-dependent Clp protease protease subunit
MPNYRIVARKDSAEMFIYDVIGEGWFGGISSKSVIETIAQLGDIKTLNVRINSPGGDVFEGFAIYNALNRAPMRIEVDIDAEAASIASIIAMAGDEIRIAENAFLMIHDPFSFAVGTSEDMRKQADIMDQVRENLVQTYVKRTGQKETEVSDWMHDETWFNAEDAVTYGFADESSQALKIAACRDAPWFRNPPKAKSASAVTPLADMQKAAIARMEQRTAAIAVKERETAMRRAMREAIMRSKSAA